MWDLCETSYGLTLIKTGSTLGLTHTHTHTQFHCITASPNLHACKRKGKKGGKRGGGVGVREWLILTEILFFAGHRLESESFAATPHRC